MNITSREQLVPGANLPEANFGGRFWGAVVLTEANLQRANLSRCSFSDGYLRSGEIHTKHHFDYELFASCFVLANLSNTDLSGANLFGCDLSGANLSGANLDGADLRRADLRGANLQRACLVGAFLSDAYLDGADAVDADFRDADLTASRIPVIDDHSTHFSGPKYVGVAELQPASVKELRLNRSSLANARVGGVDLSAINYVD